MKKLIDALTVLLLTAAFGMAFYTGFIGENTAGEPMLKTNLFAIISIAGAVVLLVVGMISALISRAKSNLITNGFLIFAVAQIFAVIAMSLMMCMVWSGLLVLSTKLVWIVYIVSALVLIGGYVDAILFADVLARRDETEDADDDDKDDAEKDDLKSDDDFGDFFKAEAKDAPAEAVLTDGAAAEAVSAEETPAADEAEERFKW